MQNNHSCQLSELVNIEKGKQLNADTLSETGDYYVMNGGITPSGYYSEYNVPAGAISISEGGNSCGYVQFNEKPFWIGGHCYSLQCRTNLVDYKYIYYYLKTKEADVMALRIGSGLPNIQKKDIEKFGNAFFGCLTSIPEFACIDIVNIDRPYEEPYYQNGFTHGIRGILLDHVYKSNINMLKIRLSEGSLMAGMLMLFFVE